MCENEEQVSHEVENGLREMITDQLYHDGVLPQLKAKLKSHIFQMMKENDGDDDGTMEMIQKSTTSKSEPDRERMLSLSIVREALDTNSLHYTSNVFDSETTTESWYEGREKLLEKLNVRDIDSKESILSYIIGKFLKSNDDIQATTTTTTTLIEKKMNKEIDDENKKWNDDNISSVASSVDQSFNTKSMKSFDYSSVFE
ncbi:hypothetical protein SNEBB_010258 [Seison nebaliae]|nr:hypothetical protein SNEBB_010258 [Seison nebaliae]